MRAILEWLAAFYNEHVSESNSLQAKVLTYCLYSFASVDYILETEEAEFMKVIQCAPSYSPTKIMVRKMHIPFSESRFTSRICSILASLNCSKGRRAGRSPLNYAWRH